MKYCWWISHEHLIEKENTYSIQSHRSYIWQPINKCVEEILGFELP